MPIPRRGGWRRLAVGVSLALSLGILAVVLSAAYLGGDRAAASPLAQPPFDLFINRGEGDCPLCRQSDPQYDPEMGYFNVNCSACPINDTAYVWNRTPFYSDAHTLDLPAYNSFLFWLHRNKGCGDFQIRGMSENDTVTNVAPFSIPCTGGLGNDTIGTTFSPGPGMLFFGPGQGGYDFSTLFVGGPGTFTATAQNRTATRMQVELEAYMASLLIRPPIATEALPNLPVNWEIQVFVNWQNAQGLGVAAASPAPVTGTLVYSFGPTARISQTLVVARPQRAYVPLAARDWGGGW